MSARPQREIEYRALRALDRLAGNGNGSESAAAIGAATADPFLACFRSWPRPARAAARRLAAHANAARGRDLLWLVGIGTQPSNSPGADPAAAEAWIGGLRPFFDGLMPRIVPVEVPLPAVPNAPELAAAPPSSPSQTRRRRSPQQASSRGPRSVVALHIETSRAPFVVRAGADRLETPWLDLSAATDAVTGDTAADDRALRSATRADLIRLLMPRLDLPAFELLEAQLTFYRNPHTTAYSRTTFRWSLDASLYVVPNAAGSHGPARVVLPLHGCRGAVEIGDSFRSEATEFSVTPDKASPAVRVTESAVLVDDLGRMFLYLCGETRQPTLAWQEPATLLLDLLPTGAERAATVLARLRPETPLEANQAGVWKL